MKKFEVQSKSHPGTDYIISIWDDIEDYEDYEELFKTLNKISEKDSVKLRVSSPGGRCSIGFELYDRIKELKCNVHVEVPYPSYSMGAILALSGDSLDIKPGAFIMFHDYSTGARGKGNEIFKQTEAYKETFAHRFNAICQPFLTQKECDRILNGQDLYVKWNDNNLTKRIKRHYENC